jgi:hypothetical protein
MRTSRQALMGVVGYARLFVANRDLFQASHFQPTGLSGDLDSHLIGLRK